MNRIDFGRHSEDYAAYRPGLPASFYERLDALQALAGARVLDLATGPGTIAFDLVARGSNVVGIDIAAGQIATAQRLARERTLQDRARFLEGTAEHTGLDAGAFDLVTASQCWHWFDSSAVLSEVQRVLRPGGVLAIISHCYLAQHTPVARDSEELILQFNPTWGMAGSSGLFPDQIDEVIRAGMILVEQFCYEENVSFTHETWRGRMRTCNGVGSGDLPAAEVQRFDAALAELLRERHPEPLHIPHRVWCVVARKPLSGGST